MLWLSYLEIFWRIKQSYFQWVILTILLLYVFLYGQHWGHLVRTLVLGFSIHESSLCRSPLCVILRLCLRTRVFLRNLHCRSILTWLSRSCSSGICEADRANFEKKNEKEKRANPFSRRGQPQRDAPITLTYEKSPAGSLQFRCICHELSSREPRYILDFTEQTAEKTLFSAAVLKGKAGILMMALLSSFFESFICHACCVSFTFCLFFWKCLCLIHTDQQGVVLRGAGALTKTNIYDEKNSKFVCLKYI